MNHFLANEIMVNLLFLVLLNQLLDFWLDLLVKFDLLILREIVLKLSLSLAFDFSYLLLFAFKTSPDLLYVDYPI